MESPLLSTPLDSDIREVVQGIFENMLHLQLNAEGELADGVNDSLTVTLNFAGSWSGRVSLRCEVDQARRLASRFLGMPLDELAEQLVADVMGEIVNMIAGNLKSVFASDIRLSLAQVARGTSEPEYHFRPVFRHEASFASTEGVFRVTVAAGPSLPLELCRANLAIHG